MDFQQRYEFNPKTDLLGKGGFSKVYKATDTLLDRTVALKFFTGSVSDKYQVLNEIKKVIRFEHPNLCKYYDVAVLSNVNVVGETEMIEVGIMEYIDGGDFKTYTRKNPGHVDKLLIDVLRGLAFLHRHGIAHRDLKPQNILVKTDEDEPVSKITDFGISKVIASDDTNRSTLLGTIEYMAPEQFNPKKYGINGRITTNLDLWSFGLLVYEVVCHESFFGSRSGGISAEQVMSNILGEGSWEKAERMPAKYREIVRRCLVRNAAERVQNALELIPLFENNFNAAAEVRNPERPGNEKTSQEVTQVIEPQLLNIEEIQDSNATEEIPLEDTMVIAFTPETSPEDTQVIDYLPEQANEETEILVHAPDPSEETTQVIEPFYEDKEEQAEIPDNLEIKDKAKGSAADQSITGNKESAHVRPLKKIIVLSSLALLLVIIFIAFPFLNRRNSLPDQKPVQQAVAPPALPPVEDWMPELIPVKGGMFTMGDFNANDISSAIYAHEVAVGDFSVGKYEVTVAQFKKFIDETGYITTAQQKGSSNIFVKGKWIISSGIDWRYDVRGNLINSDTKNVPVVHVSWTDANAYCEWLSNKTNETFRLLTEAEWEFAAKGGSNSKQYVFSGSDSIDQVAWYRKNSDSSIHSIGTKKPNELGVYDMSGNALEWCNDWYDKEFYKKSPTENPKGPESPGADSVKVLRGGAWAYDEKISRIVQRTKLKPNVIGGSTGFRVCRVNQ